MYEEQPKITNGFYLEEALKVLNTDEEKITLLKKLGKELVNIIEDKNDLELVLSQLKSSKEAHVCLAKAFGSPLLDNLIEHYPKKFLSAYFMLKSYEESSSRFLANKQEIAAIRWFKGIITGKLTYSEEEYQQHLSSLAHKELSKLFNGVDVFQLLKETLIDNNPASISMPGSK